MGRGCGTLLLFVWGTAAKSVAQQDSARDSIPSENVPAEAKALVVKLQTEFGDSGTAVSMFGAGIIVAVGPRALYIATARHVIRPESTTARAIWVSLPTGEVRRADVVSYASRLDFALLRIAADSGLLARAVPRSWDRRAAGSVHSGDIVYPVGCPQGTCWQVPTPPDRVMWAGDIEILFQTVFVDVGSSGGALFNRWWEVVGMVTTDDPPRGGAIPIDRVVAQVESLHVRVGLRKPSFPRGGYRTSIGGSLMRATSSASIGGRVPSGRLTLMRQASPVVSWHVGVLRLAPDNLAITAGMVGADIEIRKGRFVARPFAEAGVGRMEGRHDLGGYYVAASGGSRYVPFWRRVTGDGLGMGGGVVLEIITLPRTILEITGAYWSFTPPENAPRLRTGFVGAGLRWGL